MKVIARIIKAAFFPNTCAACGEVIGEGETLCEYCRETLLRCDPKNRCMRCGLPKKECQCKYRIFRFDSCIAPFINEGSAKRAVYAFKFRRKLNSADFLANEMALTVKNEYRGISFDGVTFVPMHKRRLLRRGFNQSRVLAERLSEILGVPLLDLLVCLNAGKRQHDLFGKERFKNVKGRYAAKGSASGKTLLLVDDIRTTGATLDECAGQLFSIGADSVYCVTALITVKKKREENNTGKKQ
ncbi:MAG: ComF family protein [Acutalibacteraceae bacterium]